MKNKKLTTTLVAVTAAAALLLSGTFAWQSINQTALNEASDVVNPGGRLHDDFDGTNKDIYVENFADEPIYARIQLSEYMEIVMNHNTDAEKTDVITTYDDAEGNSLDSVKGKHDTYAIHYFDRENATDAWWDWTTGGQKVYMPTFNMNKDSLVADINGTYLFEEGVITAKDIEGGQYTEMKTYTDGEELEGTEIYDGDTNSDDEVGSDFDNLDDYAAHITTVSVDEDGNPITHTARNTGTAELISMADWLAMNGIQTASADDPYGVSPAFAANAVAVLHYDKNAEAATGEIGDVEQPYGSALTLSDGAGLSREGYTLVGWNTEPDGSGTSYALSAEGWVMPEDGDTLYAVWELNEGDQGEQEDQTEKKAYWVYDTDGWVYYSEPIAPHSATGLLLDGIELNQVMDDTWYYAINVVAQFITANDIGDGTAENPGFMMDGMTDEAKALLKEIGVDVDGEGGEGGEEYPESFVEVELKQDEAEYETIYVEIYEQIKPSLLGELTITDENGDELTAEDQYYYDGEYVMLTDYGLEGQTLTMKMDYEGDSWGAYVFVGEPEAPVANENLLFDGGKRNTIYPGNTYELSYTGEDGATFAVTTGTAAASIDGNTLTVNGDAKEYTYVTITITKGDGTTDTANVMVSHQIQFKAGETVLENWDTVLVGTPITAWWGNEKLRNITARDGYNGNADITELLTIDEENATVTALEGDRMISVSATYEPLGVTERYYLDTLWHDSVEVSYTITKASGETVNGTISDDEDDRNEVVFISSGDSITFTAFSSAPEESIASIEWFIGENGNTPSQNTAAFGPMTPDPYGMREWSGSLTHSENSYTISNVSEMEPMLDYHFYVFAEKHNYRWFQLILGEPAIDCKSTVEVGGSIYLSTNDMKQYAFAITEGGEYAQLDEWDELFVSEDTPVGTQITVTATPYGHDGNVLTKTITVVEGDGEETPVWTNETISAEVMQLQDVMIPLKDQYGVDIDEVMTTNVYHTLRVEGTDADLVGFADNTEATPNAVLWLETRDVGGETYQLDVRTDINAEVRTHSFTLAHTEYDSDNNEVIVKNPVELTVTATPFSMSGSTEVERGGTAAYRLTLPGDVKLETVNGHVQGNAEDMAAGTALVFSEDKQIATFTVDAAEPNDELQIWIGCDCEDGTNYYYYIDVTIIDPAETG